MKKYLLFLLLSGLCTGSQAMDVRIRGRVTCDGRGIAGVWVSDGERFAQTDAKGRYTLTADDANRFVFISVPAGYDAPVADGVVRFFEPMPADGKCDFTLTKRAGDDARYGLIITADPQIWARKEFAKLSAAADDIAATVAQYDGMPFQGICCGDLISHDHSFYDEYNQTMARTGITFRNAMGNHDMTLYGRSHETSQKNYESKFGPAYYSYNIGRVHYVCLDDNFYIGRDYFYIGYLDERQLRWLEEDLSHVAPGSTVFVAMHIPSTCEEKDRKQFRYETSGVTMTNHRGLYDLLKPYDAHIVSGHTHTTYNSPIREGLYEHVIPSLGGAWWQGELCTDGTPRGYAVFEIDEQGVRWRYKSTGYPDNYQMQLYDGRQHPEFAGYAVANIWASDPAWEVSFTIDGKTCGPAERFEAYDPAARKMYSDTSQMDHRWIYPSISDHYYRVPLPENAEQITVTATDRFGRTYTCQSEIVTLIEEF